MSEIHICLLSDQLLPNLIPILIRKPPSEIDLECNLVLAFERPSLPSGTRSTGNRLRAGIETYSIAATLPDELNRQRPCSNSTNGTSELVMSKRALYIATYDVADPTRLRKVHHVVKRFATGGQKSVFECFLNPPRSGASCWTRRDRSSTKRRTAWPSSGRAANAAGAARNRDIGGLIRTSSMSVDEDGAVQ